MFLREQRQLSMWKLLKNIERKSMSWSYQTKRSHNRYFIKFLEITKSIIVSKRRESIAKSFVFIFRTQPDVEMSIDRTNVANQFQSRVKLSPTHKQDKNNIFVNLNLFFSVFMFMICDAMEILVAQPAPFPIMIPLKWLNFPTRQGVRRKMSSEKCSMQFRIDMENNKKKFPSKAPSFCADCTYFCCYVFH